MSRIFSRGKASMSVSISPAAGTVLYFLTGIPFGKMRSLPLSIRHAELEAFDIYIDFPTRAFAMTPRETVADLLAAGFTHQQAIRIEDFV